MNRSIPALRERYEQEGSATRRYDAERFWDRRYHRLRFAYIEVVLRRALRTGDRFLDVGCGTGEYLARAAELGADPVGVDLSATYCTRAASGRGATAVVADGAELPVASRSCDVVLCSEVIEHLPTSSALRCVDELVRVARRLVVVSTPNADAFIRRAARRLMPGRTAALDDAVGHVNLLTSLQLVALLARPGWSAPRVMVRHVAPPLVGDGPLPVPAVLAPGATWLERRADACFARAGNVMIATLEAS